MEKKTANVIKKKYCKISFALSSPLILGSGFSAETDKDILKDVRGVPFIPASSIAGVCQSAMQSLGKEREQYFGYVSNNGSGEAVCSKTVSYTHLRAHET